jgi:tetratricopeptide (TPR) repeat protein
MPGDELIAYDGGVEVVDDRYELVELLGRGGMGAVYRARDRRSGADVAVKMIQSDTGARALREAELLSELSHPHVVRYLGHGEARSGQPYLVMEWLAGEDLAQRLARAPLSVAESVALARAVASALAAAHARGVVHRDLKPSNLILPDGEPARVKLIDFGIARPRIERQQPITRTGVILGTPGYMAPEQAAVGARRLDARADVFALGCVLYECLTGRPTFAGDDLLAVLAKILLEQPPRPIELCPTLPPALDALIVRMLDKAPEARPADGAAVVALLDGLGDAGAGASGPAPGARTTGEKRLVSLVLAAAPAASGMRETVDVADARRGVRTADEIAERHGAHLRRLADGTILAALWGQGVATDQAAAAARLALDLRRHLPDERLALATGRGEVAPFVVGEVIDAATRLLAREGGGAGGVWLDDVTCGLLDARFDIAARLLLGERDGLEGVRTLLGRPSPCVGRERELANLLALWEECHSEPAARVVLVTGVAGAGKSRLRHELLQRLPAGEIWLARGEPLRAGSPYGMLGQLIARLSGRGPDAREKLRARVGRRMRPEEVTRVADFLGELADLPRAAAGESAELIAARQDAPALAEAQRRAFEDFVAAEVAAGPVVIILEDLHWGDLPSVRALDAALRAAADRPLFVLALARPEIHETFPRLWAARGVVEMPLRALTRRASEALVRAVLADVPEPTVARVVSVAAGNAFYLEELIRAVADGQGAELPDTVRAMAHARLEALEPQLRRTLRLASVFGEIFWRGGVAALAGESVEPALAALEEAELVERRRGSRVPDEVEYGFRHALLQDAANAALTDGDRRAGHLAAASWLLGAGEHDALVLAEHYERGGDVAQAVDWYQRATIRTTGAGDLAGALGCLRRAIACGPQGHMLGALHALEAVIEMWRGHALVAERQALAAMGHLKPGSFRWGVAAMMVYISATFQGTFQNYLSFPEALLSATPTPEIVGRYVRGLLGFAMPTITCGGYALGRRLLERARRWPDASDPQAPPLRQLIESLNTAYLEGNQAAAFPMVMAAADGFVRVNERPLANFSWLFAAQFAMAIGDYAFALATCDDLLQRVQPDYGSVYVWALNIKGTALADLGRADESLAVGQEAVARGEQLEGNRMLHGLAYASLAHACHARGDLAGVVRAADASIALFEAFPLLRVISAGQGLLARVEQGRTGEALALAREAEATIQTFGFPCIRPAFVRMAIVEAELAAGERERALAAARAEHERLLTVAGHLPDDAARTRFWSTVPEHRRLAELATL